MLAERFSLDGESFPTPEDVAAWLACPMWKSSCGGSALTYEQLRVNLKKYFKDSAIDDIVKVTHAFRVAGARYLDDLGLEDVVCSLHSLVRSLGCW
jgi:hypothetical protein